MLVVAVEDGKQVSAVELELVEVYVAVVGLVRRYFAGS